MIPVSPWHEEATRRFRPFTRWDAQGNRVASVWRDLDRWYWIVCPLGRLIEGESGKVTDAFAACDRALLTAGYQPPTFALPGITVARGNHE